MRKNRFGFMRDLNNELWPEDKGLINDMKILGRFIKVEFKRWLHQTFNPQYRAWLKEQNREKEIICL